MSGNFAAPSIGPGQAAGLTAPLGLVPHPMPMRQSNNRLRLLRSGPPRQQSSCMTGEKVGRISAENGIRWSMAVWLGRIMGALATSVIDSRRVRDRGQPEVLVQSRAHDGARCRSAYFKPDMPEAARDVRARGCLGRRLRAASGRSKKLSTADWGKLGRKRRTDY